MRLRGGGYVGAVTTPSVSAAPGVWSMADVLAARKAGTWPDPIMASFAGGIDGFYFDFSKTDRLFQSTSNLVPADDPSEPVGLALDWSRGVYGPELGPGSDFSNLSQLTVPAGFSASVVDGRLRITRETTTADAQFVRWATLPVTAGVEYRLELDIAEMGGVGTSCFTSALNGGATNFLGNTYGSAPETRGRFNAATGAGNGRILVAFGPGRSGNPGTGAVGDWVEISRISLRSFVGNHGKQTTTAAMPKYQADRLVRFDGSDDNLLTTKIAGPTGFIMARCKPTAGAALQVLAGAVGSGGTDRIYLGVDASNQPTCRIGNGASLSGPSSIAGVDGTIGVRWNGATVDLLVNGVVLATQAQTGAPTTTTPLRIGAYNSNGAAANFFAGDVWSVIEADKALTDGVAFSIHNQLMA